MGPDARAEQLLRAATAIMGAQPADTLPAIWPVLSDVMPTQALLMSVRSCGPAPEQVLAPDESLSEQLRRLPLEQLLAVPGPRLSVEGEPLFAHTAASGGADGLRLIVVTGLEAVDEPTWSIVRSIVALLAARVRQHAVDALPAALRVEAQVAAERRRAVAFLEQRHREELEDVLAALRTGRTNEAAEALAAQALVNLRRRSAEAADAGAQQAGHAFASVRVDMGRALSRSQVAAEWRLDDPSTLLPPAIAHAAIHLTSAALQNVVDHAAARRVLVRWRASGVELEVHIADDGAGFDAERVDGPGLRGMRERLAAVGATLELQASEGWGTRLGTSMALASAPAVEKADTDAQAALATLGTRESEVLALMAAGRRNGEIAEHLHLSPHTVKTYVGRVLHKLEVSSRTEAAALARRAA